MKQISFMITAAIIVVAVVYVCALAYICFMLVRKALLAKRGKLVLKQEAHKFAPGCGLLSGFEERYRNPPKLEVAEYELNALVERITAKLQYVAAEKNVLLSFAGAENFTNVWCDFRIIASLIEMFIVWTIRCAQKGNEVQIHLNSTPKNWSITFAKAGGQIPFQYPEGNVGVLIQSLFHTHGGKVGFDKQKKTVEITFPLRPSFDCPYEKVDTESLLEGAPQSYSIFILAEDTAYGRFLKEWLAPLYSITAFTDAESLQERLRTYHPDLILVDSGLAEKWMEDVCRELRKDIHTSPIRIIQLTDGVGNQFLTTGLRSRADFCMTRPCNLSNLRMQIANQIMLGECVKKAYHKDLFGINLPSKQQRDEKSQEDNEFMEKACKFVQANLEDENLKIADVAREMTMSRSSFYNRIRVLTGENPQALIRRERICKAKALLATGKYRVNEIHLLVGLKDEKYFSILFKKEVGMTPGEYISRNSR